MDHRRGGDGRASAVGGPYRGVSKAPLSPPRYASARDKALAETAISFASLDEVPLRVPSPPPQYLAAAVRPLPRRWTPADTVHGEHDSLPTTVSRLTTVVFAIPVGAGALLAAAFAAKLCSHLPLLSLMFGAAALYLAHAVRRIWAWAD